MAKPTDYEPIPELSARLKEIEREITDRFSRSELRHVLAAVAFMAGERDRLKTQSLLLAMALELNGELIADDQFPSPRAYGPRVHRDQVGNGPATLN